MASRAAALGLRAALDATGSGRPGRPTETGRANGQSGHRPHDPPGRCPGPRGAAPDPGGSRPVRADVVAQPGISGYLCGTLVQATALLCAGIGSADGVDGRFMYEVAS